MAHYYEYIVSSLPMLHFGMKPPFSFERFLDICRNLIPDKDIDTLSRARLTGDYITDNDHPALKDWHSFDTSLRNELAKIRASRKKLDAARYLHKDGFAWTQENSHLAINAYRNPSIIDAEKLLDEGKWHYLDEMSRGHYFDLHYLLSYALKLLILERWERIRNADKEKLLNEVLAKG